MPNNIYRKPKHLVTQVYQGNELENLLKIALQKAFSPEGIKITSKKVKGVLSSLPVPLLGFNPVLILEHYPLHSMQARGKLGKLVYQVVNKTGNQYARKFVKPKNPRTPPQQGNRMKLKAAQWAWTLLSPAEKETWEKKKKGPRMNGNNLFVQYYYHSHP